MKQDRYKKPHTVVCVCVCVYSKKHPSHVSKKKVWWLQELVTETKDRSGKILINCIPLLLKRTQSSSLQAA